MFDQGLIAAIAIAVLVLACPLMMAAMMGMMAFPRSRHAARGHGHMMCHDSLHDVEEDREEPHLR